MRIAVVCPYDIGAPGGVQQICLELVERLQAAGEQAHLIAPGNGTEVGGRVRHLSANRSTVPLTLDMRAGRRARRLARTADVVHVHEPLIPVVGWAAAAEDKPMVGTFHAAPATWTRLLYRLGSRPGQRLFRRAELTAVSPMARKAVPGRWGPVTIIPNALDVASYDVSIRRHPHRLVFLGRDDPRKGLDVLLEAWPWVRSAVPDAELVVVGSDRPTDIPGVEFRGFVDEEEKRRVLASSTVHVAPNLGGESFGIVVAEGMAAGCAVVASDLPAFAQVLGSDGILVPVGRAPALARSVVDVLTDPARASALGAGARRAAARFDWSEIIDRYLSVYESAIRRRRSTIPRRKE